MTSSLARNGRYVRATSCEDGAPSCNSMPADPDAFDMIGAGGGEHTPTPWQMSGSGRGGAAHLTHSPAACMPECMYERPSPFMLSGRLPPAAVLRSTMNA